MLKRKKSWLTVHVNEGHVAMIRDEIYNRIDHEFQSGNLNRGLWIRALAESDGNQEKTKARYIKQRAAQLNSIQSVSLARAGAQQTANSDAVMKLNSYILKIYSEFTKKTEPMTKAERSELQRLKKKTEAEFRYQYPALPFLMAGRSYTIGGRAMIFRRLEKSYHDFFDVIRTLPSEFCFASPIKALAALDEHASGYLFYDNYRHLKVQSFFAKLCATNRKFDDNMDQRAWRVARCLKQVRLILG